MDVSMVKDVILGKLTGPTNERVLEGLKHKKLNGMNGLKIGIKYITNNIDVEDGLVNGVCGILNLITFENASKFPGFKAHVGYAGNEEPDRPAKEAAELNMEQYRSESVEAIPSGSLRKGSIDVVTADITSMTNRSNEFVFRIVSPYQDNPINIAAASKEEMLDWVHKIRETAQSANDTVFLFLVSHSSLYILNLSFNLT
ncbi:hypothetical protein AVEN_130576-1 [Araneus ventricosus]|uniref:PH domain-containing protein n=1 Tax=Araneus ventricosus TaxID=182803 RepID=A0A4Y2HIN2_ARAVE|nr:hypothetical protein AVEN_130576-1 [Araneus ventricosus]